MDRQSKAATVKLKERDGYFLAFMLADVGLWITILIPHSYVQATGMLLSVLIMFRCARRFLWRQK
jgi:uncharacterized membrane protein